MRTKGDLDKRIRSGQFYKRALELARTDEEKKRIEALAGSYVDAIAEALLPLIDNVKRDPALAEGLRKALAGDSSVISSSLAPPADADA